MSAFKIGGRLLYRNQIYRCIAVNGRGADRVIEWEAQCKNCGRTFAYTTGAHWAFAMRQYCDEHRPTSAKPRASRWLDDEEIKEEG